LRGFDTDRQVFFKEAPGVAEENRRERSHSIFAPVALPALGEHVFSVAQDLGGDPARIDRQSLSVMSVDEARNAIRLRIHTLENPAALVGAHRDPRLLAFLTPAETTVFERCAVF
jgi:hypothetical protein